jgi:hypothetical protein
MAGFGTSLERIRRFLRDPNGNIWTDNQLLLYWNQAETDLAQKTGLLVWVRALAWPTRMNWTYHHEFEKQYTDGDRIRVGTYWYANDMVLTCPWEASYWMDDAPSDEGHRWTQPWECDLGAASDPIPTLYHAQHHKMVYIAFDEEPVEGIPRANLARKDDFYRTRVGEPTHYYPLDEDERTFALYPRPSSVTHDDLDPFSDGWEDTGGIVSFLEELMETQEAGIPIETIETAGNIFMVFQITPTPADDVTTESDFPEWVHHYVECGVLERAFGADTDGFIPSLRDYWRSRKELAIEALKRFRINQLRDRRYRRGGERRRVRSDQHPRFPDGYPAVYP